MGEWRNKKDRHIEKNSKIADVNLNTPIKSYRLAEQFKNKTTTTKKHEPSMCCLQETHFRVKDTNKLKMKEWKRYIV